MPTSNCKYRQENLKEKKKKGEKKKRKTNIWQKMGHLCHCKKKSISFARKNRSFNEAERSESEKPFYKLITFGNI
jgi:hypothetical protein